MNRMIWNYNKAFNKSQMFGEILAGSKVRLIDLFPLRGTRAK
jgi:hypothetical protein